jgi:hypothetical protein
MSKISLAPDASGTGIFTIASPGTSTNRTLTLPDDTGTLALAGAVPDKIEEGDSKVEVTDAGTGQGRGHSRQCHRLPTKRPLAQSSLTMTGADVRTFVVEGDTDANLLVCGCEC